MAAAEAAGVGPVQFEARTGIGAQDLLDVDGRLDGARHERCVELIHALSPSIEWLVDRQCGLYPHFPALGNHCFNAPTLREAISAFLQFRSIIGEFDFLFVKQTPGWVQVEYVAEFMPHNYFQALANFQVLATLIRTYDIKESTVFHVSLTGTAPRNGRLLEDFFGAPVRFDSNANQMRFDSAMLDAPFPHYNAALAPHLLQQLQQQFRQVQQGHSFSATVEQLISEIVMDCDFDNSRKASLLSTVCERLETSRWTLNRQLRIEGLNFSDLETRVKLERACRLLRETRCSLSEISDMLGFSSQSAFTRFFRSGHQMAPQTFRQRSQQHHAAQKYSG